MDVEVLSAIFVPLVVALIGVIGTQLFLYYRVRKELSIQKRVEYFKDAFADNFNIQFYLLEIEIGHNLQENVQNIQRILDSHSYNVSTGFSRNWVTYKNDLFNDNSNEQKKAIQILHNNLSGTLKLYSNKYLKDVLGFTKDEIKKYVEAMRGKIE